MKKWTITALLAATLVFFIEAFLIGQWLNAEQGPKAYMLLTDVDAGQKIKSEEVVQVVMPKGFVIEAIKDPSGYQNKELPRDLPRGKVLTKGDFVASKQDEAMSQSVVVKLVKEYAHKGEVQVGETISVLCYTQGNIETIENIKVQAVENPMGDQGESIYYVTLSGGSKALESIAKAQLEGNVQIIRNLSFK